MLMASPPPVLRQEEQDEECVADAERDMEQEDKLSLESLVSSFRTHLSSCEGLDARIRNAAEAFEALEREIEDEGMEAVIPQGDDDWDRFSNSSDTPSLTREGICGRGSSKREYTFLWRNSFLEFGRDWNVARQHTSSARESRSAISPSTPISRPLSRNQLPPSLPHPVQPRQLLQKAGIAPRAPDSDRKRPRGLLSLLPLLHKTVVKTPSPLRARRQKLRAKSTLNRRWFRRQMKEKCKSRLAIRGSGADRWMRREFSFASGETERARGNMRECRWRETFISRSLSESRRMQSSRTSRSHIIYRRRVGRRDRFISRFLSDSEATERARGEVRDGGRLSRSSLPSFVSGEMERVQTQVQDPSQMIRPTSPFSFVSGGTERVRKSVERLEHFLVGPGAVVEVEFTHTSDCNRLLSADYSSAGTIHAAFQEEKDVDDDWEAIATEEFEDNVNIAAALSIQPVTGQVRVIGTRQIGKRLSSE